MIEKSKAETLKMYLIWLGLFILCLPGIPLAVLCYLIIGLFDKSGPGTSGMLGLAILIAVGSGALGWAGVLIYSILEFWS